MTVRPAANRARAPGPLDTVRSIVLSLAAAIGVVSILFFLATVFLGIRTQVVTSGSMEPTIPTGSLLLVRSVPADTVEVGDIVTVGRSNGEGLVTHRVIAVEPGERGTQLTLQGDANSSPDPNTYVVTTVGAHLLTVPVAGYAVEAVRTPLGLGGIAVVAVAVLAAYGHRGHRGHRGNSGHRRGIGRTDAPQHKRSNAALAHRPARRPTVSRINSQHRGAFARAFGCVRRRLRPRTRAPRGRASTTGTPATEPRPLR